MIIEVRTDEEIIFNGEAEDFLEINDYDEEIEELLNELSDKPYGTTELFLGNQFSKYEIEKLKDEDLF